MLKTRHFACFFEWVNGGLMEFRDCEAYEPWKFFLKTFSPAYQTILRIVDQNLNSHLLPLFISYRSGGEKLIKLQANSSYVIISIILITTLFYKALILQGEIWFLGLKGLIPYFPHYLPAAVHALDPNLPQNSRTWKWDKCTTVGEENRIM